MECFILSSCSWYKRRKVKRRELNQQKKRNCLLFFQRATIFQHIHVGTYIGKMQICLLNQLNVMSWSLSQQIHLCRQRQCKHNRHKKNSHHPFPIHFLSSLKFHELNFVLTICEPELFLLTSCAFSKMKAFAPHFWFSSLLNVLKYNSKACSTWFSKPFYTAHEQWV